MVEDGGVMASMVDGVVFGGTRDNNVIADAKPAFDGCAGFGTWSRRDPLMHTQEFQQGRQTVADKHVTQTQLATDVNEWTGSRKEYQKRQYPGAPVRKGTMDATLFNHDFASPRDHDKHGCYKAIFGDCAGNRTWRTAKELEPFRRLGNAGRITASSPTLSLPGASNTDGDTSVEVTPRQKLRREVSASADLNFASQKMEVRQDFQDACSTAAGVASWSPRSQVRKLPRAASADPAYHVRPAGVEPREGMPPLSTERRLRRGAPQVEEAVPFDGAAGKLQYQVNDSGVMFGMRGNERPHPVLGGLPPWARTL